MNREEYINKKAKHAYELYLKGEAFKKVYAVVEKNGKYLVLKKSGKVYKYQLSGGGVDEGEDNITAIKRELLEELNVDVEVIKSLGHINMPVKWRYEGKEFLVDYDMEIFFCKFLSYGENSCIGLEGEFNVNNVEIAEISKEEMINNVAEFAKFGLKFAD